ncbi:MAG: hypothetical protein Q8876_10085 [Bacillota bacterium]|nr:hypothetical protein [Bacillota bacterium]
MRKIVDAYKKPNIEAIDNAFKIILPNLNYTMTVDTERINDSPDAEKV